MKETKSCSKKKPCDLSSCRYFLPGGGCVLEFADKGGMSQREVARVMGVSRSYVWQIERQALAKIKRQMRGFAL